MKRSIFFFLLIVSFFCSSLHAQQYILNGNATQDNCHCYTLTKDIASQTGSVWNKYKIDLTQSFDFVFTVNLGCKDDGADGIAFVLQPISTSIGSVGGGMGIRNVSPSVAVTLDTYQNITSNENDSDPAYDHIAIQANGNLDHNSNYNLAGPIAVSSASQNVEDCKDHLLRIKWDAAEKKMETWFDGVERVTVTNDIVANYFNNDPNVYWGFTAATGGMNNVQKFCTALSPNWSYGPAQTRCINDIIQFKNETHSFAGIRSFEWDFGDGSPKNTTELNPSHKYTKVGDYEVTLRVIGTDGCEEIKKSVLKISGYPTADFEIIRECGNPVITLKDISAAPNSSVDKWEWTVNGSALGSSTNIVGVNAGTTPVTASLKVTTPEGCASSNTVTKTTSILVKPDVEFSFNESCKDEAVFFRAADKSTETITSWQWNFGDATTSTEQNPTKIYTWDGTFATQLIATAQNGCKDSVRSNVVIKGTWANAGRDTVGAIGQTLQLNGTGGSDFEWMPAAIFNDPFSPNPSFVLTGDEQIILKVSNAGQCISYDTINIKVLKGPEIYVPTAFTPNGDGLNDVLRAIPAGIVSDFYFSVYDRYGRRVFHTSDRLLGWTGKFNQTEQPLGTYVWLSGGTDFNGVKIQRKGTVVLIR